MDKENVEDLLDRIWKETAQVARNALFMSYLIKDDLWRTDTDAWPCSGVLKIFEKNWVPGVEVVRQRVMNEYKII